MDLILQSVEQAVAAGCLLPAVITTLTIPDIAGAVDDPDSRSQTRYVSWLDKHFASKFPAYKGHGIDGTTLYALRCKLLHEGLTSPSAAPIAREAATTKRKRLVAFNVSEGLTVHLSTTTDGVGDEWTVLDTAEFCRDLVAAARSWLSSLAPDSTSMGRLSMLVTVRQGVPGLLEVPVICASV
jgi:hypothetical protein